MTSAKHSLLDQLIVSGSNFLIIVLAARFLDIGDVAKYAYAFGFYMFVYMVANAWVYQNIMAIGRRKLAVEGAFAHFAGLNFILVLISVPIIIVSFQLVISGGQLDLPWTDAILVGAFVATNQMIDFERRSLYFLDHSWFNGPAAVSLTGFLVRIVAIMIIQPSSFIAFMMILVVFSLPSLLFSAKRLLTAFKADFYSFVLLQIKNGKWMTLNIPVNWVWGQAPVFIMGSFLGPQAAGVYAAVRSVANLANVAMELIPTYFASRLSRLFSSGKQSVYKKYIMVVVVAGILAWGCVLILIILVGDKALSLILGEEFSSYWFLLYLFWGFNAFVFLSRIQFLHFRFVEKTGIVPVANLVGVITLSVSYFLWFSNLGVEGMAWAMIAGGGGVVSTQYLLSLSILKDKSSQ